MIEHITAGEIYLQSGSLDLLEYIEFLRLDAARKLGSQRKAELGQFFTPAPVARLMASLLTCREPVVRILDAGAGVGSLFAAAIAAFCQRESRPMHIHVTAYEIDPALSEYLQETLKGCQHLCTAHGIQLTSEIHQRDFLEEGVALLEETLFSSQAHHPHFHCAILNPPYRKIQTQSSTRKALHRIGIEVSNLYAGFLAIAIRLLDPMGELVAITPRSFCNGPYFKSFRQRFLETMVLSHLHVFESRQSTFQDDEVLQENIILHAIKGAVTPATVTITSSTGAEDDLISVHEVRYHQVVHPDDRHAFIHIVPDAINQQIEKRMAGFHTSLRDLGLEVSTGRVVDFRATPFLRATPASDTAPLLYPTHVGYGSVHWPKQQEKKPQAILIDQSSRSLLVPNEHYVLIKRFSSKEEKKRVVAAVYEPASIPGAWVGFENHLNYVHQQGHGLSLTLARGLAAYLNSTLVDGYFRQFNGHTQVNATDLRNMNYPTRNQLLALGTRISTLFPPQQELDQLIKEVLLDMAEAEANNHDEQDPVQAKQRIEEALHILKDLGFPRGQQNERSALTLLALVNVKPETPWSQAENPLRGITPMMEFFKQHYGKDYAPNTRETVRRQTVHQFLDAGLILLNPDQPDRPVNSPKAVYQIEQGALELVRTYNTPQWEQHLRTYLSSVETLKQRYAQERAMARIPVKVAPGKTLSLSPGGQNILVERIIHEFASRFVPGGTVLYVGDTDKKFAYVDEEGLAALGITIEQHGKMPDVILYHSDKDWLVLIEAVTSHGPIDPKRKEELTHLFRNARPGLVFVTAFLTRTAMVEYLSTISWETEVWVAESPSHLIHFNGERFLGPYWQR